MQARVVDVLRLLRVVYEIGGGPESAGLDRKGLLFAIAELCADSASDRLSSTSRVGLSACDRLLASSLSNESPFHRAPRRII